MTGEEHDPDWIEHEEDRIARLIAELNELGRDERDEAIAALPEEDREALLAAELVESEASPVDDEELGGEG